MRKTISLAYNPSSHHTQLIFNTQFTIDGQAELSKYEQVPSSVIKPCAVSSGKGQDEEPGNTG